ncbi:hypothetical protein [Scytonema sp. PCC 10023]|uniref:hypothetical protein n=1 Tax=Scytonema sp. PCC 10023 TaxID=1680591 RepID=UPI0039C7328A
MKKHTSLLLKTLVVLLSFVFSAVIYIPTSLADEGSRFYLCTSGTEHTLYSQSQDTCIFTPKRNSTNGQLRVTNNDPYKDASLSITSPTSFQCQNISLSVNRNSGQAITYCERSLDAASSITVSFGTTNSASNVTVRFNEE